MNIVDLILKKRDGKELSRKELHFFVQGVVNNSIPDYQISAMLMAIYFSSLNDQETANLTMEMAHSGDTFDLSSVPGIKVDKHSTGGVADTTTLILAPLVASLDIPVVKMSGRGLGFSGGTLDKLDAIPGFRSCVSYEEAISFAKNSGIVLMSQTENLTPADQKLYALRDVTGTVENMPLIASSIMSKKIASGADAIVLDVKCGSGAFMKDLSSAKALAEEMVSIGRLVNRQVKAVISSMEQPLGNHIGNALEVEEAIEILKGNCKGDLLDVSLTLGAYMVVLAKKASTVEEARFLLKKNIENGKGLEKFRQLILQQKGNPAFLENYSLLPRSTVSYPVFSSQKGYLSHFNTAFIGRASLETGAGRISKTDQIDYGAGIQLKKRIGDFVEEGELLALFHASTLEKCENAAYYFHQSLTFSPEPPEKPLLILETI